MNLKDTYNLIAEDYYKEHSKLDKWSREDAKVFGKMFKRGSLILDVGCGPGIKSNDLHDQGVEVVGIDISEKMIEIAKKVAPKCIFYVLDMNNIDQFGKKFDGIFAQAALLHLTKKEVQEIIKKFYKILNKNGLIYIGVKKVGVDGIKEKNKVENDYGYSYERYFSYFTSEEMKKFLESANFKIINSKAMTNEIKVGDKDWVTIIAHK